MIERINISQPVSYKGLEDSFPEELRKPMLEIVRRLEVNTANVFNAIRTQVVVDTEILPALESGAAAAGTKNLATTEDIDMAVALASLG